MGNLRIESPFDQFQLNMFYVHDFRQLWLECHPFWLEEVTTISSNISRDCLSEHPKQGGF